MANFFKTDQRYVLRDDLDADYYTAAEADARYVLLTAVNAAWTADTAAVQAAAGTITSATCARRYIKVGRIVHCHLDISIINAGTGSGLLAASLPYTAVSYAVGIAMEINSLGASGTCLVGAGTTNCSLRFYDNTTVISTGFRIAASITYEATS